MKRILVVDDELPVLELMRRSLAAAGYRITATSNAVAALNGFDSEPFHLVVTDFRMPQMNGREVIDALRSLRPGLKTIVVSGAPPESGNDHAWWTQEVSLTKPFSPNDLKNLVERLIGPP